MNSRAGVLHSADSLTHSLFHAWESQAKGKAFKCSTASLQNRNENPFEHF